MRPSELLVSLEQGYFSFEKKKKMKWRRVVYIFAKLLQSCPTS